MATATTACAPQNSEDVFKIDNRLTQEEIVNGVFTPEVLWKFGLLSEPQLSPNGQQVVYVVKHTNLAQNKSKSVLYLAHVAGGEVHPLTSEQHNASNPRWSNDGRSIRFIYDAQKTSQLFEVHVGETTTEPHQISDVEEGIDNFEFSPQENKILYSKQVKMFKTTAELYPDLPQANVRIISNLMYRHWNKWTDEKRSHLFCATFAMGRVVGQKDITPRAAYNIPMSPNFDMADVCWGADGNKIYYAAKPLNGKRAALSTNSDIFCYDFQLDTIVNLTAGNLGYDIHPVISPDGNKMAWLSMKTPSYESDKKRLMVLDLQTNAVNEITSTMENGAESMVWAGNDALFFISGQNATYQVFRYNEQGVQQLTRGAHDYTTLAWNNNVLVGRKMSMSMAPELFAIDPQNGEEQQISSINKNIYEHIPMGKIEERWIKTVDYKDMHTWVMYPPNFDPQKKYPILLYCQGGPQNAVSQYWSSRWNLQLFASQGYIVVAPNRRGTPTFGQYWLSQISGDYAGLNIFDYYSAIDAVKRELYVDESKMGALGASYGGYSVFYLAGTHNKRFKAFISHCGMFNLESLYGTTEELFFVNYDLKGPYWSSDWVTRQIYKNSPHRLVQNWDTPILISVGEHDYRVPYTEGMQAFNAAQMLGIPSKLLFFPEETHFVSKPQNAALWHHEQINWLNTYLRDAQ